jgi:hypothetical protein
MKPLVLTVISTTLFFFSFCSHHSLAVVPLIYKPPVVFAGYVNDDYDTLPGNPAWPNTAKMLGDTLRMYFYSEDFHTANKIWNGDLMILTILPNANDTLISTRSVYLQMFRYLDQDFTYQINPGDSTGVDNNSVAMRALALSRTRGSSIDLENISVTAEPLSGTTSLIIDKGRIIGTIP